MGTWKNTRKQTKNEPTKEKNETGQKWIDDQH